ncbi:MAG: fasciclin domain-containing protein [Mycobacteriaceae bacterium]
MPVHRTAPRVASFVAVSALAMSACSSSVTDAEPASSSSRDSVSASDQTTTTTDPPTPATTVEVPAGLSGPGCAGYMEKVPSGPGSLLGMSVDPVAVALANSPQLTTLAGALSGRLNADVNLVETLNKGEYTVFAPMDEAFARLDPALIEKFKTDSAQLTSVLDYHVVSGDLDPSAVVGEHKTLQGQSVTVTSSGDDLRVNNAGVVCGGIKTANATVYLVDTVLIPRAPAPATSTSGATDTSTVTTTPTS